MENNRIKDHPILGPLKNQKQIQFTFDGKTYVGYEGDTIASALLANGMKQLRVHEESSTPRGIYCNIGHCYECRLTVNGESGVRACLTKITEEMVIKSGKVKINPFQSSFSNDLPRTYEEFLKLKKKKHKEDHQHV